LVPIGDLEGVPSIRTIRDFIRKSFFVIITAMRIRKVIVAVLIWFFFWFAAQSLLLIPDLLSNLASTPNAYFSIYSLWILFIAAIAIILWRFIINDFSFLKVKNRKILFLYLIPIAISIALLTLGNGLSINRLLYVVCMSLTTFLAQDVLTFGFLQTYLDKVVANKLAAVITGLAFFVGHLTFDLSWFTLVYIFAAILFSFLRYKTKNVYLLNIIHISFLLLPISG